MTVNRRPRVDDIIEYDAHGTIRRVRVTEATNDIKDGMPGFSGHLVRSDGRSLPGTWVWGYDDQITAIAPRAPESEPADLGGRESPSGRFEVPHVRKSQAYAAANLVGSPSVALRRRGWNELDAVLQRVADEAYAAGREQR